MAAASPSQTEMSLVPYSSHESNAVVLRNDSALVVYDENRKQLALRAAPPTAHSGDYPTECPYCHRPLGDGSISSGGAEDAEARRQSAAADPNVDVGFVSPEYFRMLRDHETGADDLPSAPPKKSPRRQLTRPVGDSSDEDGGQRANASAHLSTPSGSAEFVSSAPTPAAQGISAAAFSPSYFQRFFTEEKVLGKGGKGVVLLVRHVLDGVSLGHFACKRVPVGDDHQWLEKVLVEVQLLQHLSHQNLVSYRHVWLEDVKLANFGPSVPCAFILQQYCNAGDLHDYVCSAAAASHRKTTAEQLKERMRRRSKGQVDVPPADLKSSRRLQFEEVYSFFKGITSGLNHLHQNGFIHRDLKPSNCLLHETGGELRVLVSDFGEAQRETMSRRSTGATGTISFCAPEVLRREYPGGPLCEFTAKSDIFSLGMILFFMCFGRLPYKNANELDEVDEDIEQLRDEISAWSGFDDKRRARSDLPDQLYKFLKRLLALDPVDRPSAEETLRGISAGGQESPPSPPSGVHGHHQHHHHTRSSSIFEDIRGSGSRISPVETPPPGTPFASGTAGQNSTYAARRKPGPLSALAFPHPGLSKLRSHSSQDDTTPPNPDEEDEEFYASTSSSGDDEPSPHDDSLRPGSRPRASRNDSTTIVLRKKDPHTASSAPTSPYSRSQRGWLPLPLPSSSTSQSAAHATPFPHPFSLLLTILFLAKLISLYHPCTPFAPNPHVAYPLACLAVLDLIFCSPLITPAGPGALSGTRSAALLVLSSAVHVATLMLAGRRRVLCLSPGPAGFGQEL